MENLLPAVYVIFRNPFSIDRSFYYAVTLCWLQTARLITSGSIAIIFLALLDAAFENQFPLCKPSLNLLPTSTWWQPHPPYSSYLEFTSRLLHWHVETGVYVHLLSSLDHCSLLFDYDIRRLKPL